MTGSKKKHCVQHWILHRGGDGDAEVQRAHLDAGLSVEFFISQASQASGQERKKTGMVYEKPRIFSLGKGRGQEDNMDPDSQPHTYEGFSCIQIKLIWNHSREKGLCTWIGGHHFKTRNCSKGPACFVDVESFPSRDILRGRIINDEEKIIQPVRCQAV